MTSSNAKQDSNVIEDCIACIECGDAVIGEYCLNNKKLTIYEYDPFMSTHQQKVLHGHQAGPIMERQFVSRIAIRKRMLLKPDPGDYHYIYRKDKN